MNNNSVKCPICDQFVTISGINDHLDNNCQTNIVQMDGTVKTIIKNKDENNNGFITNNFQKINSNHIYLGANSVEKKKTIQSTLFNKLSNKKRSNDNLINKNSPNHSSSDLKSTFDSIVNNNNSVNHLNKKIKIEEKVSSPKFDINKKYDNNYNSNKIDSMKRDSRKQLPLAELVRPKTLDDYFGQEEIMGKNSILKALIMENRVPSLILWGPPGVGKY